MRKFLMASAFVSAAAMAVPAPAAAQYPGYGYGRGQNIDWRLDRVQQRIERSYQRGRISNRERHRLHREARHIERLHYRWMRNGLSRGEAHELRARVQNLRHHLRDQRRDGRGWDRDDRAWDDDSWDRDTAGPWGEEDRDE